VYCQLGRTTHLKTERERFYPKEDVLAEIINKAQKSSLDFITFVGDGEPTLCKDLGWLLRQVKTRLRLPAAVITNGSLLFREDVRHDISTADVVMPTLDAGNERMFRAVNRAHGHIDCDTMLRGQVDFRREYAGQIWVEVMLIKGLNDTEMELRSIKRAIDSIGPDRVYALIPIRPPAEPWVKPSDPKHILRAQDILGGGIAVAGLETGAFGLGEFPDARKAILEIGSRHPLRREQAAEIEEAYSVSGTVDKMLRDEELIRVDHNGEVYVLPGHFRRG
jgi:wyosine [tRNA(Phe)-imidazoG37] synthetase (radical SAM superfamily)